MRLVFTVFILTLVKPIAAAELILPCYFYPKGVEIGNLTVEKDKQTIHFGSWPKSNSKIVKWVNSHVVWTSWSERMNSYALFIFNRETSRLLMEGINFEDTVQNPELFNSSPQTFTWTECRNSKKAF